MNVVEFQVRPIDQWPRELTKSRQRARFSAPYGSTMQLLDRELKHLRARGVVLLMALSERDIRLDGRPRANAKADHPGVILCFEDRTGAKRFPCDKFDHWHDNLRAIALSLEALRTVDRYGVTTHGEQYRGWQALPSPNGDHWNADQAREWLSGFLGLQKLPPEMSQEAIEVYVRSAEKKAHPDTGGNASDFHKVQQARKLLLGDQRQ